MPFDVDPALARCIPVKQPSWPTIDRPVYMGDDWWDGILHAAREYVGDHMAGLVVDERVSQLYPERVLSWHETLPRVRRIEIQGGEQAKTLDTFGKLQSFLLSNEIHHDDVVISMGGGTISDVVGFTAASYTRGLHWINLPTTLIAMVDCAIGGKTGINIDGNKNYCGTYYWPNVQFVDLSFLGSLPDRFYYTGFSEIIKLSLIDEGDLFDRLCKAGYDGLDYQGHRSQMLEFAGDVTATKARVTSDDPYQQGIRNSLLMGHVTAHALEGASRLRLHHGEALSIGLAFESYVAEKRGLISRETRNKLITFLEHSRLPVKLPKELHDRVLVDFMRREKRRRGRSIKFILPYENNRVLSEWPNARVTLSLDEVWQELSAFRIEMG